MSLTPGGRDILQKLGTKHCDPGTLVPPGWKGFAVWRPPNLNSDSKPLGVGTFALLALVIVVVAFSLSHLYRIEIFVGTLLIVLGSAGAMIGLEGVQGNRGKLLRALVVGAILALGSYWSNDGMSKRQEYLSDREALISFNVERQLNGIILRIMSVASENKFTDEPGFTSGHTRLRFSQAYVLLNTTGIITKDQELRKTLNMYIFCGEMLASGLEELGELSRSPFRNSDLAQKRAKKLFGKEGTFNDFCEVQEQLDNLIASHYPWSSESIWNRLDRTMFEKTETFFGFFESLPPESQKAVLKWFNEVREEDQGETNLN